MLLAEISKVFGAILGDRIPSQDELEERLEDVAKMLALAGLGRYDSGFYYHGVPSTEEERATIRATDVVTAHQNSFKNREAIAAGERCGCFHCLAEFAPGEIREWADDGMTALCPRCGIDSVIPLAPGIDAAFLEHMQARWWQS